MAYTRTNKRVAVLRDRARELRRRMTPAESRLWKELRGRRFVGFKFRRQYPFGPFILDFYCPEVGVCVEPDGESHVGKDAADKRRRDWLESQGIKVVRVYNHDVYEDKETVLEAIYRECVARRAIARPPHPQPLSPKGGEGGSRGEKHAAVAKHTVQKQGASASVRAATSLPSPPTGERGRG